MGVQPFTMNVPDSILDDLLDRTGGPHNTVFAVWGISQATYSQIPTQAKTGIEWATRAK